MGRFVNPDNSGFQTALNAEIYVDKTEIIGYTNRVLESTDAFICNSRPRRFGKSITADMLAAYYSKGCDSESMFSKYKISQTENFRKYMNQYDVIHFDVQWCMNVAGGPDQVIGYITENVIQELREFYPEIVTEKVKSVVEALSRINEKTKARFVIIIDEWDVLIRDEAMNHQVQEQYINFLRDLFKGILPTKYIALAYLTGILPVKKVKTQSALNNFSEFTMLDARILAQYIGFTEGEVKELCVKKNQNYDEVKRWYDGYLLEGYQVYNPKSVIEVMKWKKFQSYWSQTGSYDVVVPLINMNFDGLRNDIITMLSGQAVEVDVSSFQNDTVHFENKDDVLTYLIHLGYLGYDQTYQTAFIPNEELRQEMVRATRRRKWNEMISFQKESEALLNATLEMDTDAVAAGIEKIHMDYASTIQYHDENSLSSVLTIAYLSSMKYYFKPIRELPTGRGFADFVYLPKPEYREDYPALVVEMKWNQKAVTAIEQIKEKRYPESLKQYTGDLLLAGISYNKKTKEYQCKIESNHD